MDYEKFKSSYAYCVKKMFRCFLELCKPGIVIGNIISIMGSFLFASHSKIDFLLFFNTILGTSLVIASSCVFNNLIDVDIDKKMNRTKNRVLAKNVIMPLSVLYFGVVIGLLGVIILGVFVNFTSMCLSIFGFFVYVVLYTLYYKRKSTCSTFIGSFSGSIPSVIGYTAVTNSIDLFSIFLFLIFIFWQMSHFYSISVLWLNDYKKANIPVFSVINGIFLTKKHILYYVFGFTVSSALLTIFGYLSYKFLFLLFSINVYWLFLSYYNCKDKKNNIYTQKLFYYSIFVIVCFNFFMSIDHIF